MDSGRRNRRRRGLGIALLPSAFVRPRAADAPGLALVPVADGPRRAEYLVWNRFNPSPATRAMRRWVSTYTPRRFDVRMRTTSSSERPCRMPAAWPVPCAVTLRPRVRAARTVRAICSTVVGTATAAGLWSTATFHGMRTAS